MLMVGFGLICYAIVVTCLCALMSGNEPDDDDVYTPHRPTWAAPTEAVRTSRVRMIEKHHASLARLGK